MDSSEAIFRWKHNTWPTAMYVIAILVPLFLKGNAGRKRVREREKGGWGGKTDQ